MPVSDLLPDTPHGLGAKHLHVPVWRDPGNVLREFAQQLRALRRVHDFGVEHGAVKAPGLVGDQRKWRVLALREHLEAGRQCRDAIAVAHPNRVARAERPNAFQQRRLSRDLDLGASEFAFVVRFNPAAQLRDHGLLAIANAKDRHAQPEDAIRRPG